MKMKEIINKWDPACLFPMAPKDEYADEIRKIEEYISSVDELMPEALADVINEIFLTSFGKDVYAAKNEDCFEIAKKICEVYLWNCVF